MTRARSIATSWAITTAVRWTKEAMTKGRVRNHVILNAHVRVPHESFGWRVAVRRGRRQRPSSPAGIVSVRPGHPRRSCANAEREARRAAEGARDHDRRCRSRAPGCVRLLAFAPRASCLGCLRFAAGLATAACAVAIVSVPSRVAPDNGTTKWSGLVSDGTMRGAASSTLSVRAEAAKRGYTRRSYTPFGEAGMLPAARWRSCRRSRAVDSGTSDATTQAIEAERTQDQEGRSGSAPRSARRNRCSKSTRDRGRHSDASAAATELAANDNAKRGSVSDTIIVPRLRQSYDPNDRARGVPTPRGTKMKNARRRAGRADAGTPQRPAPCGSCGDHTSRKADWATACDDRRFGPTRPAVSSAARRSYAGASTGPTGERLRSGPWLLRAEGQSSGGNAPEFAQRALTAREIVRAALPWWHAGCRRTASQARRSRAAIARWRALTCGLAWMDEAQGGDHRRWGCCERGRDRTGGPTVHESGAAKRSRKGGLAA